MLRRVSNKEVRDGLFSVSVSDIHQIKYSEGSRIALIEIEGGMNNSCMVDWLVYESSLRGWEPPHEYEEFSIAMREKILERVSESLRLLKMPHRVE